MTKSTLWSLVAVVLFAGCGGGSPVTAGGGESALLVESPQASSDAPQNDTSSTGSDSERTRDEETWDAIFLNGTKAGYSHTRVTSVEQDGRQLVKVEVETFFSIKRFGQSLETTMHFTSYETPEGDFVRFDNRVENSLGTARGWVEGDKLVIEVESSGKPIRHTIDWSGDVVGYSGEERLLAENPLKPGDRRTLKTLAPIFNKIAEVELLVEDYEEVELLDRTERLLRVTATSNITIDGLTPLTTVIWINEDGEALKSYSNLGFLQQTSYRVSREVALQDVDSELDTDLGFDTLVHLARPITQAHRTKEITYRITVEDAEPAELFAEGPTQTLKKLGPNSIELHVRAMRPDLSTQTDDDAEATHEPPAEYLQSNSLIQSDNPEIVRVAQEAAGDARTPMETAQRLEKWVFENLTEKNFTRAFASAAEVMRDREGDCTEHAVLLAALARARKIPARVAIGLVYIEGAQSFGYHMWTEVFAQGRWVPLDGTLGRGGIGAAHIKLSDTSLAGVSVAEHFLQVLQVLGKTKIEVLDVKR